MVVHVHNSFYNELSSIKLHAIIIVLQYHTLTRNYPAMLVISPDNFSFNEFPGMWQTEVTLTFDIQPSLNFSYTNDNSLQNTTVIFTVYKTQ